MILNSHIWEAKKDDVGNKTKYIFWKKNSIFYGYNFIFLVIESF